MDWAESLAADVVESANPGFALGAPDHAQRLVGRIAAALRSEREACAKLADNGMLYGTDGGSPTQDEIDVAQRIAAAIRSRQ